MATAIRGLTGEDEAGFVEEAARGTPVFGLLAFLLGRLGAKHEDNDDVSSLTAGQAQALALRLRAASIDAPMRVTFPCSQCGERLDLTLDPLTLIVPAVAERSSRVIGDISFAFRPITVADILAGNGTHSVREAALAVLERCALATDARGGAVAIGSLPDAVVDEAASHLLALDPQAETLFACDCPACGTPLEAVFDPAQSLAAELAAQGRGVYAEVLAIASRTGWTEQAILAMPRHRRRGYATALGAT